MTYVPRSTTERGYGAKHQRRRKQLLRAAVGTPCPLCGAVMLDVRELDLDHSTPLAVSASSVGDRIAHAVCNRAAGGALSQRRVKLAPSRVW